MMYLKIFQLIKRYDFSFFGLSFIIFLIGVLNLYSITATSVNMSGLYKTQISWYILSFVVSFILSFFRSKIFFSYSWFFYIVTILCLVLVLSVGHVGMGAQRWIDLGWIRFQPSEVAKLSVIFILARWFSRNDPEKVLKFKDIIIPGILAGVPAVLIVIEPDLGTGLLILLIFISIIFYKRLDWKTGGILFILCLLASLVMYSFGLKEYQKKRVKTFLNPSIDARGSGYNAIQSKIAIGSGQFLGKGFKKSSQASLNYLPENHTDFVFSIYNEEHGFLGACVLIFCYLVLIFRFLWLSTTVLRVFDSIVVIGILSLFFWHTVINMSMVMGIMPIVGLPLPFMSYGGSSLMIFNLCCGIATSMSNSRNFF